MGALYSISRLITSISKCFKNLQFDKTLRVHHGAAYAARGGDLRVGEAGKRA
jgi:hypothetical protein